MSKSNQTTSIAIENVNVVVQLAVIKASPIYTNWFLRNIAVKNQKFTVYYTQQETCKASECLMTAHETSRFFS